MNNARARFVEAMRPLAIELPDAARQAVEAFADAECAAYRWTPDKSECRGAMNAHRMCRASLLRECGLADE